MAAGAIVAGFWFAGLFPHQILGTREAPAAQTMPAQSADEISSRLDKIQQTLQTPAPDQALSGRVTAVETQTKSLADTLIARLTVVEGQNKSLGDSLAALNRRVDEVAASSQTALAQAKAAATVADGAKGAIQASPQRSEIDALASRIAALESAVKSLSADMAQRPATPDDAAARLTVAAEALRAAVERGAPYQAELAAVKALGGDNATAPLDQFAASGVPSAALLAQELAALTPSLLQVSGPANESSLLGRLEAHAQRLVRITPIAAPVAAPAGDDPSSVIARINIDAVHGDIAGALADLGRLPEATRAVAEPWIKKAEAREAALGASRRLAAAALGTLGRSAPQ
jgi:hypothetical protein